MITMLSAQKAVLTLFQMDSLMDKNKCMTFLENFSDEKYKTPNVDIPMKHSQYNILKNNGDTYIIYNTLFNSMITLSSDEFKQYEKIDFTDLNIVEPLVNNGFIIPDNVDEFKYYQHYKKILSNEFSEPHYTIALTTNCNARCIYCYENGISRHDMTFETADKIADLLIKEKNNIDITWFGGEPLLKADLIGHITDKLSENGKTFSSGIITNGSLLTEDMIVNKFKSWNVTWIQITLDGMEDEYFKRKRYVNCDKNIYNNLIENISLLTENQILVSVRLNIDNDNANDCIKTANMFSEKFSDNPFLDVYPAFLYGNNNSICSECERVSVSSEIYKFYNPEKELLSLSPKVNACFITQQKAFVIDTDGSILACDGDVGDKNTKFSDIYEISEFKNLIKPISFIPELKYECQKCSYYPKCGGGCSRNYNNKCEYDACFMEKYKVEFLLNKIIGNGYVTNYN